MNDLVACAEAHTNTCALHTSGRQRDGVLVPFVLEGLCRGQKCLVWLTESTTIDVKVRLGSPATVEGWLASGQLEVHNLADTTFSSSAFWIEDVVALWEDVVSAAVTIGGFDFTRIVCEANWCVPQSSGRDALIRYEATLNSFCTRYPTAILSLYDVSVPDGGLVFDLVRTHPRILLDGISLENPHYLTPEHFVVRRLPRTGTPSRVLYRTPDAIAV